MAAAGVDTARLEICQLDLLSDQGWAAAVDGCRYVLHVASPLVLAKPEDPDELIRPAVEGATRAVGTALHAGAEHGVMTSALATMQFAHAPRGHIYTDADWTAPDDPRLNAYTVSKVKAQRAARELAQRREVSDRSLSSTQARVIGPLLTNDPGTSVTAIQQIMSGRYRRSPTDGFHGPMCGTFADAHIAAMTSASAAGRRAIIATDPMSLVEVARVIRERLPEPSQKMPARAMPTWFTWLVSVFEPRLRDNRWLTGQKQRFDRTTAETLLWVRRTRG